MRERIDAMAGHVAQSEDRVAGYAALGGKIRALCGNAATADAAASREIVRFVDEMDATLAQLASARRSPKDARSLADQLAGLADQANWEESFKQIDSELRAIGSAQDRTLAKCRMDLRRLRQYCVSVNGTAPASAPLADKIVACINEAFHTKE